MALTLELITGSDLTLDRENLTISRKFRVKGTLPYTGGGDAFDYVSSYVMSTIAASYATYGTPMGTLYWNSIQLHEQFYGQLYDASVTYTPWNKASGTYQITVDQAVGQEKLKVGERIAGFGPAANEVDNKGAILVDPVTNVIEGCDYPVEEDRITVSYRHPQAYLNASYIRNVGRLRGHPNSDTFLGYEAGEVLYMGGNFTQTDCEASASYSFSISPNATNIVVGSGASAITITSKAGWDFISPTFKDEEYDNGTKKVPIKSLQYIEIIRPRSWSAYKSVFGWG